MKHVILLLLLGSGPAVLHAQNQSATEPSTPGQPAPVAVKVGAKLGLTYTNMNFNAGSPKPVVPVETTWKPGIVGGLWVRVALPRSGHFSVQQEYLFTQLSSVRQDIDTRYTMRYLSLPLLLQYRLGPRVRLMAGPQFDLLIQAEQETGGQATTITHDTEERGIEALAGLEVQLNRCFSVEARYLQGLNHVGIGQRTAVQEFKYEVVQVLAGITF